jgi:NAD-dependent SIR2 family protein deacetylase
MELAIATDFMICLGSSLVVKPAMQLPIYAVKNKKKLAIVK